MPFSLSPGISAVFLFARSIQAVGRTPHRRFGKRGALFLGRTPRQLGNDVTLSASHRKNKHSADSGNEVPLLVKRRHFERLSQKNRVLERFGKSSPLIRELRFFSGCHSGSEVPFSLDDSGNRVPCLLDNSRINKRQTITATAALLLLFMNSNTQQQHADIMLAFRILPVHNAIA